MRRERAREKQSSAEMYVFQFGSVRLAAAIDTASRFEEVWSDGANHPKLPARSQELSVVKVVQRACVCERQDDQEVDRERATHG